MIVSYDKLWVILNERNMMKTDLVRAAKISTNAMAKLGRNEDVRVGVFVKIFLILAVQQTMSWILFQKNNSILLILNYRDYKQKK